MRYEAKVAAIALTALVQIAPLFSGEISSHKILRTISNSAHKYSFQVPEDYADQTARAANRNPDFSNYASSSGAGFYVMYKEFHSDSKGPFDKFAAEAAACHDEGCCDNTQSEEFKTGTGLRVLTFTRPVDGSCSEHTSEHVSNYVVGLSTKYPYQVLVFTSEFFEGVGVSEKEMHSIVRSVSLYGN